MNDIITNKIQSIQRCIVRAREEFDSDPDGFASNHTVQDAAVLNVLRACEQAIDLANHLIQIQKMGIPTSSADSFDLLQNRSVIDIDLSTKLKRMVHFRNVIIHQYQNMDIDIVKSVISDGLDDLVLFGDRVLSFIKDNPS